MGAMHMALLGPEGLQKLALRVAATTEATKQSICQISGVEPINPGSHNFREFAVKLPGEAADALAHMDSEGVLGGLSLGEWWDEDTFIWAARGKIGCVSTRSIREK